MPELELIDYLEAEDVNLKTIIDIFRIGNYEGDELTPWTKASHSLQMMYNDHLIQFYPSKDKKTILKHWQVRNILADIQCWYYSNDDQRCIYVTLLQNSSTK